MMAMQRVGQALRGTLLYDEPMAKHTSWRVGGPADQFFVPADRDDLALFLAGLDPTIPLYWLGLGSNLLVRDSGVRGVVIATHKGLGALKLSAPKNIYVEAGVAGAKIARFAVRHDLRGAEFFAGIPGTFGGALAMNAGAFGSETWDVVSSVETIDRRGRFKSYPKTDFEVSYRSVRMQADEWFVAGTLALTSGNGAEGQRKIKELLAKRADTQPIQMPNAGSVFRNPPDDYAARLIELSGLKGAQRGAARVSDQHANFIVNTGGATAADIEALIEKMQYEVELRTGVRLVPEVRVMGDPS